MVEFLGEEVAQDAGRVATADLIGRQGEVDALDKVPELSHKVLIKHPDGEKRRNTKRRRTNKRVISHLKETFCVPLITYQTFYSTNNVRYSGKYRRHFPHSSESKRYKMPSSSSLPLSDCRQNEEHPQVDAENQNDLEDELAQDGLAQVEGPVDDHGAELDEQHDQEGLGHLVILQRGGYVSCSRVFLRSQNNTQ